MTTLSHLSVGYILAEGFIRSHILPPSLVPYAPVIAMISANLPDIDALIFKKLYDHRRNSPFHYPFTWWLISMTVIVLIPSEHKPFVFPLVLLSVSGILSHFLMDTFGVNAGIRWFAPFYKKEYSFLTLKKKPDGIGAWIHNYISHPIMRAEVLVWLIGIIVFFFSRFPTVSS